MSAPQPDARVSPRWAGAAAVLALLCTGVLAMTAACTPEPGSATAKVGLSVQTAVALLEQGRARGVLTVAGIVTDDDPTVDQTLVADDARGILVPGAPWPTRPAAGSRVVLEGQLRMGEGGVPTMTVSRVVSIAPGKVPDAVLIEAGELTLPRFLGQRVQLKTQLQGLAPATDRVRITATSRAIQYDIDAHGIARGLLTGFLGAQVRVSGAVWPPRISPSGEPLGRLGLSSIGDLVVLEQGVLAGGARRVLTTVDEVRRLDPRDAALGHQIKVRASVTLVDLPLEHPDDPGRDGRHLRLRQPARTRPAAVPPRRHRRGRGRERPRRVRADDRRPPPGGGRPRRPAPARADHARAPPRRARGQPAGRVRRRRPRHHPRRSAAPGHRAVARQPPLRHPRPVVRQPADPRGARRRRRDSA